MNVLVEVVCYNLEDVFRARQGGAQRVEICSDPGAGGTTPNYGLIKKSAALGDIGVMVMIRPRGGDFLYNSAEIAEMEEDIRIAAELGAQGVVFGVLDAEGSLDSLAMSRLVQLAKNLGLEVTCHRAFDNVPSPRQALQTLMDLGVDRVLTSGQRPTAVEGLPLLRELIELADGRISIMPGGGVRPHNVHELLQLPIGEIHTGSRTKVPSKMKSAAAVAVGAQDAQEFHQFVDPEAIRAIVRACQR
ncbi:MAG: copper homeostasis protein CutC [Limnochordia bacterium]|jgi:copper homeostasis protein|nr:copper homeostasis protein CutC [Limnochordia bacterium]NLO95841.1 copper homeostasis protein CutC [Bacillota bacterium]HOB41016.1 copper homeostasis protein CutC [Limnochordia bacterium]HOK32234.1 copper homeostasis protein CutC [Limnochordia bacterium]HOM00895.1 copper homeostasis protein CutC [Limnochordia bacterium]